MGNNTHLVLDVAMPTKDSNVILIYQYTHVHSANVERTKHIQILERKAQSKNM